MHFQGKNVLNMFFAKLSFKPYLLNFIPIVVFGPYICTIFKVNNQLSGLKINKNSYFVTFLHGQLKA